MKNEINIPQNIVKNKEPNLLDINENLTNQLEEIMEIQIYEINENNVRKVTNILYKTDSLITECHTLKLFNTNRSSKFARLTYEYQKLNSRYELYLLKKQEQHVEQKYNDIIEKQNKLSNQTDNLVYNILGFIASFSIVSAAVTAIDKIDGINNIMLFMTFCAFILLTTLIGLNNFYKNDNKSKNILKNNYFLWWALLIIILLISGYNGIKYIKENQQQIFESIGMGIATYQQENGE